MSMSAPTSIPDTAVGFTASELQLFRQQQQVALQGHQAQAAARGRGQHRTSHPSSRNTSAASSQGGQGRIFLDPGSLHRLNQHFETLMRRIRDHIEDLEEATQRSVQTTYDRAGNMIQNADAEIARMRRILAEIDQLEEKFDQVKRIRDVVKQIRSRADDIEARLEAQATRDRSRSHGQGLGQSHSHSARDSRRR